MMPRSHSGIGAPHKIWRLFSLWQSEADLCWNIKLYVWSFRFHTTAVWLTGCNLWVEADFWKIWQISPPFTHSACHHFIRTLLLSRCHSDTQGRLILKTEWKHLQPDYSPRLTQSCGHSTGYEGTTSRSVCWYYITDDSVSTCLFSDVLVLKLYFKAVKMFGLVI